MSLKKSVSNDLNARDWNENATICVLPAGWLWGNVRSNENQIMLRHERSEEESESNQIQKSFQSNYEGE